MTQISYETLSKELDESMVKSARLREVKEKIEHMIADQFSFQERKRLTRYMKLAFGNCFETVIRFNVERKDPRHDHIKAEADFMLVAELLEQLDDMDKRSQDDVGMKLKERVRQILYRAKKIHKKFDRYVPSSLLTKGTTFNVGRLLGSEHHEKYPFLTVESITTTSDPRHFMITTKEIRPSPFESDRGQMRSYQINSAHVQSIIKYVPGHVVLTSGDKETLYNWMKEKKINSFSGLYKTSRNHYTFTNFEDMLTHVMTVVDDRAENDNIDKVMFFKYLAKMGVVKAVYNEDMTDVYLVANKKRVQRAVKQNKNRFLIKVSVRQARENATVEADNRMYASDMGY